MPDELQPLHASVVTYNNAGSIADCIASLQAELPCGSQIFIWDNNSEDETVAIARKFDDVVVKANDRNLGFAAGHNRNLEQIGSDYILLINPDATLKQDALLPLVNALENDPGYAAAAPAICYPDGAPQVSWGSFPTDPFDSEHRRRVLAAQRRETGVLLELEHALYSSFAPDWVSGACMLVRRQALERIDYFDEGFFLYMEDVDLCRRLRNHGYTVQLIPEARCLHVEGGSEAPSAVVKQHFRASKLRYLNKHVGFWAYAMYALMRRPAALFSYNPGLRQEIS